MRGCYFYNQVDYKVFVSTNAIFMTQDYMMSSNKAKCDIDQRALENTPITT